MFFVGQVSGLVKNVNIWIYSGTVDVINVNFLHDVTTHLALPVYTTFNNLDHISRSQQC